MMLKIFTFRLYLQNHDHKSKVFLIQAVLKSNWSKVKNSIIKGVCYN